MNSRPKSPKNYSTLKWPLPNSRHLYVTYTSLPPSKLIVVLDVRPSSFTSHSSFNDPSKRFKLVWFVNSRRSLVVGTWSLSRSARSSERNLPDQRRTKGHALAAALSLRCKAPWSRIWFSRPRSSAKGRVLSWTGRSWEFSWIPKTKDKLNRS